MLIPGLRALAVALLQSCPAQASARGAVACSQVAEADGDLSPAIADTGELTVAVSRLDLFANSKQAEASTCGNSRLDWHVNQYIRQYDLPIRLHLGPP